MSTHQIEIASAWSVPQWEALSAASKALWVYGGLMASALLLAYVWSLFDPRTLREVGVWSKPMKFMAATALFAWTTAWLVDIASALVSKGQPFKWIVALIIVTSLFEVAYISHQAARGAPSHYNTSDALHAMLFGVMALAAVGLTASQAWLAWEILKEPRVGPLPVVTLAVVVGLVLTFVLSTISGFQLGGHQPPPGTGLPLTGWHLKGDIRPAHFLGVHAQQFVPLIGLLGERTLGSHANAGLIAVSGLYVAAWAALTWMGLRA